MNHLADMFTFYVWATKGECGKENFIGKYGEGGTLKKMEGTLTKRNETKSCTNMGNKQTNRQTWGTNRQTDKQTTDKHGKQTEMSNVLRVLVCEWHFWVSCFLYSIKI